MAAFELADLGVGAFPVGFFGLDACGCVDKDGAVKHRGHQSSRGHYCGDSGGVRCRNSSGLRSSACSGKQKRALQRGETGAINAKGASAPKKVAKVHKKLQKTRHIPLQTGVICSLRTDYGIGSQEIGGLKPGAGAALVNAVEDGIGT